MRALSTTDPAELVRIYDLDVNLVVLERPPDAALSRAAAALPEEGRWTWRLGPGEVEGALGEALGAGGASLARDAAWQAGLLADLVGATALGVRLMSARAPTCPAFHVDRVGLRLISTLLGPGTEVLDEAAVDRRRLGYAGRGEALHASGLVRPGGAPWRVPTRALAILKGEAWPGNEGRGCVHRSPAPDPRRVFLTVEALA